jgi:eukaryotic-like serine/threonine-protein kinase
VLYQMVTGSKPFVEDEKKSAMHKIRLEKHAGVRTLNPETPRELANVIDKCLEKQPRDRWRSAQHCVMALERFLAKHVEMNHHARLVLFLKSQGVITDLEAEQYLNPAALGAGAGALQQPNLQARNVVRAGVVAHGVVLGVLLMFLGLIHVAPLSATPTSGPLREAGKGFVRADARPWANVFVDGRPAGTTPLGKPLQLVEGKHVLRFEHDWYAPVERAIDVEAGAADAAVGITVDFEAQHVPLKAGKAKPAAEGAP